MLISTQNALLHPEQPAQASGGQNNALERIGPGM